MKHPAVDNVIVCKRNNENPALIPGNDYVVIAVDISRIPAKNGYSTFEYNNFIIPHNTRILVKGIASWLSFSQFQFKSDAPTKKSSKPKSRSRSSKMG